MVMMEAIDGYLQVLCVMTYSLFTPNCFLAPENDGRRAKNNVD